MKFNQYYLECLSHASYLVGDETSGRAVVVDPQRDVSEYIRDAKEAGLTIELIIETHFHADFLSGHLELAEATGAKIVYSAVAETEFEMMGVEDGERYDLGGLVLEFRQTPGHTPESLSIVIFESADAAEPWGVLTGDTLFIGDVGRPDLLSSIGFTQEELADSLYDSLHDKIMTLPDETKVFPSHGAGSACGKNLSTELESTIGAQKLTNYALLAPDKATFLDLVTEGQPPAPSYFLHDAILNRKNRPLLDETEIPVALSYDAVKDRVSAGAIVLDGRDPDDFAHGHLQGAINVGMDGRYSEYSGSVVSAETPIILFVDPGHEVEARNRLARIGFDEVIGYLADPYDVMTANPDDTGRASRLTVAQFTDRQQDTGDLQVIDIRNPGELEDGTIGSAVNIPTGQVPSRLGELDPTKPTVVFCAGGYRSSIAASVLRQAGFSDVSDLIGGYDAWKEAMATS